MLKLGRKPRTFNPKIPHLKALRAVLAPLPTPPIAVDYTKEMSPDFGAMLNDSLGDCTCAAVYHARQVWTFNASGSEVTEPDGNVERLYEQACGYNPSDPNSDQGGVEQDVLTYLLNTGAPIGPNGSDRDKIVAFIEVDHKNLDDIKRTISECGVCYIGVDVPQSVMDNADDPTKPWDTTGDQTVVGGHAIVLVGYDLDFFYCISWGQIYKITHNFLADFLDEAYAIADRAWLKSTGNTPFGLSLDDLETLMIELKGE